LSCGLALFIYFVYSSSLQYNLSEIAKLFLPLLLIVIIPISAWIYWNVRKGNYSNMDVSNRKQRKSLYFFIAALFLFLFYDYFFNENIDLIVTFLLLLLLLMQLSNYFVKSSMYTAFNVFVATLFFGLNSTLGIIWFLIAVLVGVTRIILKRHTVIEVISGALIALLDSFIYLYTNIQQH
jgi:membrane-associated phospholipid phosphatase